MVLSHLETENEVTDMSSLHGLAKREPIIATSMFVFMLALVGVPPLAGFMSKFLMVTGIVQAASADVLTNSNVDLIPTIIGMHWTFFLAIAIFINSAISLYYYLRIGVLMFFEEAKTRLPLPKVSVLRFVILCALGTIFFGVNSDWLVESQLRLLHIILNSKASCLIKVLRRISMGRRFQEKVDNEELARLESDVGPIRVLMPNVNQ